MHGNEMELSAVLILITKITPRAFCKPAFFFPRDLQLADRGQSGRVAGLLIRM